MNIITCQNEIEVAKFSLDWLKNSVEQFCTGKIYLPAGNTPIVLYSILEAQKPEFFSRLTLYQIDEVLNQDPIFKNFFKNYLPSFLSQFHWINSEFHQAEMAILGLGINGHVGFHEPELPKDFIHGEVRLSKSTCDNLKLPRGSLGLSYGVGAFKKCKSILLIVTGEKKKNILNKILNEKYPCPAYHLIQDSNITIITDIKL